MMFVWLRHWIARRKVDKENREASEKLYREMIRTETQYINTFLEAHKLRKEVDELKRREAKK